MSLPDELFSATHIKAIAATLFHSIWQGALLAVAAGAILLITRKASARLRYNLLVTLLVLFTAAVSYTYILQVRKAGDQVEKPNSENITVISGNGRPTTGDESIVLRSVQFFHEHASLITLSWLLLVLIRLSLISVGYLKLNRTIRRNLSAPTEDWLKRFSELTEQMRIRTPVKLMQSVFTKVPVVIGHFRPLVIVPAGMLMTLPYEEAEAILRHELAHIRRNDYLQNILQQLLESVFFFHPAVMWVCSLISEEREHCCDDIATAGVNNKRNYINALVSIYEQSLPPAGALSFRGRQYSVMNRIKRIIHHSNKTLNFMEKALLTVALVIAGFLVHAYQIKAPATKQAEKISQTADTLPKKDWTKVIMTEDGKEYVFVLSGNRLHELYVDNQKIPAEQFDDYRSIFNKMQKNRKKAERDADMARAQDRRLRQESQQAMKKARREIELANKEMEAASREMNKHNDVASNMQREFDEKALTALKKAEATLNDAEPELEISASVRAEVQAATESAQREIAAAHLEISKAKQELSVASREISGAMREIKKSLQDVEIRRGDEEKLKAVVQLSTELALQAAELGLKEANDELKAALQEVPNEKMDRKTYKERKKELREEYKNNSRSRD